MKTLSFSKMHGCGNSFVMINDWNGKIKNPSKLAKELCSPAFGIGADGLILLRKSKNADCQMVYLNNDGSSSSMCGNGLRCTAAFYLSEKSLNKKEFTIETGAGVKSVRVVSRKGSKEHQICVDMGEPQLSSKDLAVDGNPPFTISLHDRNFTFVSMGNPHAVTFVEDFSFDLTSEGRRVEESREVFPNKTNVEFIQKISPTKLRMRVWERGCGITLACGSGACAAVVAANLKNVVERKPITVELDGGNLKINWDKKTNHVLMTGPAILVGTGEIVL